MRQHEECPATLRAIEALYSYPWKHVCGSRPKYVDLWMWIMCLELFGVCDEPSLLVGMCARATNQGQDRCFSKRYRDSDTKGSTKIFGSSGCVGAGGSVLEGRIMKVQKMDVLWPCDT